MTKHQIYVSYAEANEGWVIDLIKVLKQGLFEQLGKIDEESIWGKYMLRGIDQKQITKERINNATYLIVILSPAYLNTLGAQEVEFFNKLNNVIVIEHDKIDRIPKMEDIIGYRFWKEDERKNITVFDKKSQVFHKIIKQMARDIAILLSQPAPQNTSNAENISKLVSNIIHIHGNVVHSNINIGDNSQQVVELKESQ
ncbi:hypothetical protein [Candidatus Albibeggiatoa sp. nov. NOAA]|uniref:hypothetical protein n=1 Tax=Candidatus Albibeggiatoa sp. nov. NOAA TaxID=3162724 RepID=UPI0032F99377|nr:toll/interleukin-1 receptor domain-containing protein [Thiotrichaceae bacterium]